MDERILKSSKLYYSNTLFTVKSAFNYDFINDIEAFCFFLKCMLLTDERKCLVYMSYLTPLPQCQTKYCPSGHLNEKK